MTSMIKQVARGLMALPDRVQPAPGPTTPVEDARIARLREVFAALPRAEVQSDSQAERFWVESQRRLQDLVATEDPREFLRWDVVMKTMFVGNHRYVVRELAELVRDRRWRSRWRPAVRESVAGRPWRYFAYPWSSGNLLHHCYHVYRYEKATACSITDVDLILEFGGGYGSMCRLLRRLGFRGRYVVFDLPQFSALQRFFLESLGDEAPRCTHDPAEDADVYLVSSTGDLDAALAGVKARRAQFIATWSLSEAPVRVREQVFDAVRGVTSRFLVAYQDTFGEVDNVAYLEGWRSRMDKRPGLTWLDERIDHLPGNGYLFGA